MEQVARNATMEDTGHLNSGRYLLHDRDKKFCREFRETLAAGGVKCAQITARSPNLNAHAEAWVGFIKEECLSRLTLFGETSLRRVVSDFLEHYHLERTIKARTISCSFPSLLWVSRVPEAQSDIESGLGAYSTITRVLAPRHGFEPRSYKCSEDQQVVDPPIFQISGIAGRTAYFYVTFTRVLAECQHRFKTAAFPPVS
jgi:hypothetical protein